MDAFFIRGCVMTQARGALSFCLVFSLGLLVLAVGCTGGSTEQSPELTKEALANFNYDEGLPDKDFKPPATLEDLDSSVAWLNKPVVEPMAHHQKELANYKPAVTPQEACELRPKTIEDYDEILAAMKIQPSDANPADEDATWVHHESGDVNSLNPLRMSSTSDFFFATMTSVQLTTSNIKLEPVGDGRFVKSWQGNDDNTIHKFVIRDDLTWSDGKPITAYDWEFTFKVLMHPKLTTMFPAIPSSLDKIKMVKAYDDHTLVIFYEMSSMVNDLKPEFPIIPKHLYEAQIALDPTLTDSDFYLDQEQKPVVGGPYEVVIRERNQRIILRRRDDFYMHDGKQVRPKPYFKEVRIEIISNPSQSLLKMTAGQLDDSEISATNWDTEANTPDFYKNNIKVKHIAWSEGHIIWNTKRPYFDDPRVRRAMSYAVDYDTVLNVILKGIHQQANGPFHPTAWYAPQPSLPMYTTDLDQARELLAEAGWKDTDSDGILDKEVNGEKVPFTFQLMHAAGVPTLELIAKEYANDFSKLGIKCEPRGFEWTVLQEKARQHTFDAMMSGWGSGGDPFSTENIYATDEFRNYGQYSNPRVDELYDLGFAELDREKRAKHYQEIAKILHEEQPYTWIYYRADLYGFNKKMRGYQFSPTSPWFYEPGPFSVWKAKAE
ncbi:peptide ABC transporter substrate-binding protein [bacterium]|nr:peptide ABC transporter substrate-binding protein [bacterium]